jgi:glycosyltransferase involved in cell wall biosynthesis
MILSIANMTNRINILMSIDHISYGNYIHGAGRVFLNILAKIDKYRFNIIPCILRKYDQLMPVLEKQETHIKFLEREKFDPLTLLDFLQIIKDERVHLLHLHQYGSSFFGRIAGALMGVPTVLHAHGIDHSGMWQHQVMDWLLAKFTARGIGVSRESLAKRSIKTHKGIVLPNGIPLENLKSLSADQYKALKKDLELEADQYIVGTITRLREEKGNSYLLEAAVEVLRAFPNTKFLIVGAGPLLGELKNLARRLGIERDVTFTGFYQNISAMLSIFDVKVIASIDEGFGQLTLLEAMAMGKAIVATSVDGITEILQDGETGLLVPPRDPLAMAEKIIHLLQSEEMRTQLGTKACHESHKYSLDAYIKDLEGIYEEVVANFRR